MKMIWGSPPHMRGKGLLYFAHEVFEGITPAHAGKSTTVLRTGSTIQDHPRTCGEKHSCDSVGTVS